MTIRERCAVIPGVIRASGKVMIPVLLVAGGMSGVRAGWFSLGHVGREAPPILITLATGWLSGVVLGPLLLPWLPGERWPFKGVMAGGLGLLLWPAACGVLHVRPMDVGMALLLVPGLASFWMMRLSGVISPGAQPVGRREWRTALSIQAGMAVLAFAPWVWMRFV